MTEIHWERVERVLTHLAEHPEQHDQAEWGYLSEHCGTVACLGGWTVLLLRPEAVRWNGSRQVVMYASGLARLAAELLGLDSRDAGWLFYEADDLAGIVDYLNRLRSEDNLPLLEEAVPALREALARA